MSPEQEKCYVEYLKSDLVQASLIGRSMPFKAIIRLRQICNHPVFFRMFHTETTVTNPLYLSLNLRHTDGMFYQEETSKDVGASVSPTSPSAFNDETADHCAGRGAGRGKLHHLPAVGAFHQIPLFRLFGLKHFFAFSAIYLHFRTMSVAGYSHFSKTSHGNIYSQQCKYKFFVANPTAFQEIF